MTVATALGPVSAHVRNRLIAVLDRHRVVVWYDRGRVFADLLSHVASDLATRGCVVVSATESRLRARREADAAYRRLDEPGKSGPVSLLIYVPAARGRALEEQQADPFEIYTRCGTAFGDQDDEHLRGLADEALPGHAAVISRLFAEGSPSVVTLDALGASSGARYPLLRQALGTDAPVDALAHALGTTDAEKLLAMVPGAVKELAGLAESVLGFPPTPDETWLAFRDRLASFVLVGELAADLPSGLPAALAGVPHAAGAGVENALQICDRLRESEAGRDAYVRYARQIEAQLWLEQVLSPEPVLGELGTRDTFPVQDRVRLRSVVQAAQAGNLPDAWAAFRIADRSLWRREEERRQIWATTERCLTFLEVATAVAALTKAGLPKLVRGQVERYVAIEGWWRLDHAQRWFEHAGAECIHAEEVDELLHTCRAQYVAVAMPVQDAFQRAVQTDGWPPEGVRKQAQTFDTHVAPELSDHHRTAYLLVDSLRFEMGRDLAGVLDNLGKVDLEGVAAELPTITPNGMAALLPGADISLSLVRDGDSLVPALGEIPLKTLDDRREVFDKRLGDRYLDLSLDQVLQTPPKKLEKQIGLADLVVVRSLDLDDSGEGRSYYRARKVMTGVLGELKAAIERLAAVGFVTFVVAADHGHVLVPEVPPGDVLSVPVGEWLLRKRRSLLGWHRAAAPGVMIMPASELGIRSDVVDLEFAGATGFKTFREDAGYFHEGLSLQECVIPVLVLRIKHAPALVGGGEQVTISYRSDRFTSSVVGLKVELATVVTPTLVVRIEAFDKSGPRAERVGEAGDCDARDPVTGEVTLHVGEKTPVPLLVDPDFRGPTIEVRATDPRTGVVYGTPLKLKNARLD